jgi:hypothetical protein
MSDGAGSCEFSSAARSLSGLQTAIVRYEDFWLVITRKGIALLQKEKSGLLINPRKQNMEYCGRHSRRSSIES